MELTAEDVEGAAAASIDYNAIIDCTGNGPMASITTRKLDEQTKETVTPRNLAEAARQRFRPLGGVELRLLAREPMREPPKPVKSLR